MKSLLSSAVALSLALAPLPLAAGPKGNGNGNGQGNGNGAWAQGFHCPPGLADRDPACEPPGQAREHGGEQRSDGGEDSWAEDIVRVEDEEERDRARALAIIGTLAGIALIERARREANEEAASAEPAPAPVMAPQPSIFSFSEVPSRPAAIERLAAAWGDATDPEPVFAAPSPSLAPAPLGPPVPLAEPAPRVLIPPAPPMAGDVTDLLGGGTTGATGY